MITIDSRTGSGELLPLFPKDLPISLGRLDFADFMFLGNGPDDSLVTVGIERKSIKDLLNSMVTGRLSGHQLPGLSQSYDYAYILVEGLWRYSPSGILEESYSDGMFWREVCLGSRRFMAKEVVAFLHTLDVKAGMHILYSHNKVGTVQTVRSLYHWWNAKNWESHTSHLSPSKTHKGVHGEVQLVKPSLVRRWAAEIPLIGWGKSKAVADYFPSAMHMATATERQWAKIPGIGKTIAQGAVEAIRKENQIIREEEE